MFLMLVQFLLVSSNLISCIGHDLGLLTKIVGLDAAEELQGKSEDYDNSCPTSFERGEWLQYVAWLNQHSDLDSDFKHLDKAHSKNRCRYDRFTHNVTYNVINLDRHTEQVRVVIREYKDYVASQGGSSFRVIARSELHKQICPMKDYLNGTYLACCSVDKTQNIDHYEINVSIQFSEFTAFGGNYVSSDQPISSHLIDVQQHDKTNIYQKCDNMNSVNIDYGYWKKYSSSDQQYSQYIVKGIFAQDGYCAVHDLQEEKLTECFDTKYNHHITMMGDSHIRFGFLRLSCFSAGFALRYHKAHADFEMLEHHFKWKPLCDDLVEGLDKYLRYRDVYDSDTTTTPSHLVVLGIGQWDIKVKSPEIYLNCLVHDVLPLLRQVQQLPRTVVIWQDMPPVPSLQPLGDSRNNYLLSAMNYAVTTFFNPIIRVPALAIALPYSEDLVARRAHLMKVVVGGHHKPGTLGVLPAGRVINDLIGYHACIE